MQIIRTGTIDADIVEANPIVFRGRLYLFEYIRETYYDNPGPSFFRFMDLADGTFTPPFAHGLHMGNAFAAGDKVYVTAVEKWGGSRFYITESADLRHWSEPRVILEDPAWEGYNTSCCRAGDRFVLAFELGKPLEMVGVPFTMFFAESTDMQHFRVLPDAVFGAGFYTGAPMLRYFDGWFYFFYLGGSSREGYTTRLVRSRDLQTWEYSPATVLQADAADRCIAAGAVSPEKWRDKAATAVNINNSDLDMVEFDGNLELSYSWGNQHGIEFLARGVIRGISEAGFCRGFFES